MIRRFASLLALSLAAAAAVAADPEFEGHCAMSVSAGARLPTDCSVVWISPEDKLYCFSSEQAKAAFMRDPRTNEQRAQANWKDPKFWEERRKALDEKG
jgi:hypothetical protein